MAGKPENERTKRDLWSNFKAWCRKAFTPPTIAGALLFPILLGFGYFLIQDSQEIKNEATAINQKTKEMLGSIGTLYELTDERHKQLDNKAREIEALFSAKQILFTQLANFSGTVSALHVVVEKMQDDVGCLASTVRACSTVVSSELAASPMKETNTRLNVIAQNLNLGNYTVWFQADKEKHKVLVDMILIELRKVGFNIPHVTGEEVDKLEVLYYHDSDREAAETLERETERILAANGRADLDLELIDASDQPEPNKPTFIDLYVALD